MSDCHHEKSQQSHESQEISFERVFNRAEMKMTQLMSESCILYRFIRSYS